MFFSTLHGTVPEDLIAVHADPNRIRFPDTMSADSINRDYAIDIDVMPETEAQPQPKLNEQERNEAAFWTKNQAGIWRL